jgi:hypothetical protein
MAHQETLEILSAYLDALDQIEEGAKAAHAEADTFFKALVSNQILAEHDARMLVYGGYQGTLVKIEKLAHQASRKIKDI